ncbi:MAG: DUF58 domain-containing protein [Acidimicrobiia bacterium]|nr:DUF58 domain-containing protein [Acidimicrobiia bacterium]MDH4308249.1 DUF58 domain-containing protein [Acidimicrobiia bacterium]MDH5293613.1 DUF58 domain-containing protein [Acidimicrobiia bacterium]
MRPELLAKIHGIELAVVGRVEGLLQGDHRGLLPGPGGEPGDARPYVPGDDVRRIDWNVTARSTRTHVRDTTADRELETTLVFDMSASMEFGSGADTKADVALGAGGVFGFLTDKAGDRVGAVIAGKRTLAIPARTGRSHVYGILARASAPDVAGGVADLAAGIHRVALLKTRRGLVVVVSDFLGAADWVRPMRALAGRHDVVAVEVFDPREETLVNAGSVRLVDPETGRAAWIDTGSASVRRRFADLAKERRRTLAREFSTLSVTHIPLSTGGDWGADVVAAVLGRRRRMASTGRSA